MTSPIRLFFRSWFASLTMIAGVSAYAAPPPAVLEYRHHMFDVPIMTLANRTTELMFDTARVEPGRRSSELPKKLRPLDFTYEFEGVSHSASEALERTNTDAFLIIRDGSIVNETYLNRTNEHTHFMSYSMAKSFNSLMLGIALRDGKVSSVTDPITKYVPEVAGTAYDGATLRDVLQMRSGSDWNDNFFQPGPAKDINEQAFMRNEVRYVTAAYSAKRAHAPGTVFNYNTVDAALIGLVIERAVGQPISRYMSERLWKPAGMESYGFYVLDGPPGVGREFTGGGFNAVLRDYGRIGQLMLDGGTSGRKRIVASEWITESTAPAPGPDAMPALSLGYAYFWWTLNGTRAFAALGGEGQIILVDPPSRTVIVKLSHVPVGPEGARIQAETFAFLKAILKQPWSEKSMSMAATQSARATGAE
jgi:CubicO group peptidase (beta-lactamase class C family)